jgi:dCMP deaminase
MRPSKIKTFLEMAKLLSKLSTCSRRQVGAIIADDHWRIIGSGYNGNAKELIHCIDEPCKGSLSPSGTRLDLCEAIHAEQNALMQCSNIDSIAAIFVTTSPCMHCLKMLMNTNCKHIYFSEEYVDVYRAEDLWIANGDRYWTQIK